MTSSSILTIPLNPTTRDISLPGQLEDESPKSDLRKKLLDKKTERSIKAETPIAIQKDSLKSIEEQINTLKLSSSQKNTGVGLIAAGFKAFKEHGDKKRLGLLNQEKQKIEARIAYYEALKTSTLKDCDDMLACLDKPDSGDLLEPQDPKLKETYIEKEKFVEVSRKKVSRLSVVEQEIYAKFSSLFELGDGYILGVYKDQKDKPKHLGEGSYGVVVRAALIGLDGNSEDVAVKKLALDNSKRQEGHPISFGRYVRHKRQDVSKIDEVSKELEIQEMLTASSSHLALVKVVSGHRGFVYVGERGGIKILSLYPLAASNLEATLSTLDSKKILHIFKQIALGIKEMHDMNIVHRDLKPDNILVLDAKHMTVGISDFGSSVDLSDIEGIEQNKYSQNAGTQGYQAIEGRCFLKDLSDGPKSAKKSDIFSLGVILWRLLQKGEKLPTGGDGAPFTGTNQVLFKTKGKLVKPESDTALGLVWSMTERTSAERPTIEDVLSHPWVKTES